MLPLRAISYYQSDKQYRLLTNIRARRNALEVQADILGANSLNRWKKEKKVLDLIINSLLNNGVNNKTEKNYREARLEWKKLPKTTEEHSIEIFDDYVKRNSNNHRAITKIFLRNLREQTKAARKEELTNRLMYEIAEAHGKDWFVVFNTLTVRNEHIDEVFENSKIWQEYIRCVSAAVGGKEGHRYFAVTEIGSKTGRLHIHVIHMMKRLPEKASDPNSGRLIPTYREIGAFKGMWKYGFSAPIAVRLSTKDAYAKIGWRWPARKTAAGHEALKNGHPGAIAAYLGKYITKANATNLGRKYKWRTKMTRKLGTGLVKKILGQMKDEELRQVANIPTTKKILILGKRIPKALLKREAVKEWMKRNRKNRNIWKWLTELKAADSSVKRHKDLITGKLDNSWQNIGNTRIKNWMNTDTFNKLLGVIEKIEKTELGGGGRYIEWGGNIARP